MLPYFYVRPYPESRDIINVTKKYASFTDDVSAVLYLKEKKNDK